MFQYNKLFSLGSVTEIHSVQQPNLEIFYFEIKMMEGNFSNYILINSL